MDTRPDWQLRVIAERDELQGKLDKLTNFLLGKESSQLDSALGPSPRVLEPIDAFDSPPSSKGDRMRTHHQWRHKSKHQQICATCGQVRRWNGAIWRYRKQGQLVKERPPCLGGCTDSERYRELRKIVETYQATPEDAAALFAVMSWRHW